MIKAVKKYTLLGILLLSSYLGIGQQVEDAAFQKRLKTLLSHNVQEVSVSDVAKQERVIFIDAREKDEFEVSHIKGARWVGYKDFDTSRMKGISKNAKIVVYCSVGYRSEKITQKLEKAGYKDVANLYGGIFEWVNQGNPVYKSNKATQQVHTYNKAWSKWLRKGEKVW